jgi:hypothetical protein
MTEWHLGWQRAVPPERREVVMGPHRADIVTATGGVVEIQHSPIPAGVIGEREAFYGDRMLWIFDCTRADITVTPAPPLPGRPASMPCGCADERCARLWAQHRPRPGTRCRCRHEGCTGYMAERTGGMGAVTRGAVPLEVCPRISCCLPPSRAPRSGRRPCPASGGIRSRRRDDRRAVQPQLDRGLAAGRHAVGTHHPAPQGARPPPQPGRPGSLWRCPCIQCAIRRAQTRLAP